jgi:hypothetical protein
MAAKHATRRLTEFRAHGPFVLSTARKPHGRTLDRSALRGFFRTEETEMLGRRCGCYVFAIRTPKRYVPYYVGKTGAGFNREWSCPSFVDTLVKLPPVAPRAAVRRLAG